MFEIVLNGLHKSISMPNILSIDFYFSINGIYISEYSSWRTLWIKMSVWKKKTVRRSESTWHEEQNRKKKEITTIEITNSKNIFTNILKYLFLLLPQHSISNRINIQKKNTQKNVNFIWFGILFSLFQSFFFFFCIYSSR